MADPFTLSLEVRHWEELRRMLAAYLPGEEVWAYGSRVAGTAHETSDLDLVVRDPADLEREQGVAFRELKAAIRESNLPLLVDVADWARLPAAFRENISREHVVVARGDGTSNVERPTSNAEGE